MNLISVVILLLIAAAFVLSLRYVRRHGSCGGCEGCGGGCSGNCSFIHSLYTRTDHTYDRSYARRRRGHGILFLSAGLSGRTVKGRRSQ